MHAVRLWLRANRYAANQVCALGLGDMIGDVVSRSLIATLSPNQPTNPTTPMSQCRRVLAFTFYGESTFLLLAML